MFELHELKLDQLELALTLEELQGLEIEVFELDELKGEELKLELDGVETELEALVLPLVLVETELLEPPELGAIELLELPERLESCPHSQVPHVPSVLQAWPPTQAPGPTQSWVSPAVQAFELFPPPP